MLLWNNLKQKKKQKKKKISSLKINVKGVFIALGTYAKSIDICDIVEWVSVCKMCVKAGLKNAYYDWRPQSSPSFEVVGFDSLAFLTSFLGLRLTSLRPTAVKRVTSSIFSPFISCVCMTQARTHCELACYPVSQLDLHSLLIHKWKKTRTQKMKIIYNNPF